MKFYRLTAQQIYDNFKTADEVVNLTNYEDGTQLISSTKHIPTLSPLSDEQIKQALKPYHDSKIAMLKAKRDEAVASPINGLDVRGKSDLDNIEYAIKLFDTLAHEGLITWTLADDTDKPLNKQELEQVLNIYVQRKLQSFKKYQELKAKVLKLDDIRKIEEVSWEDDE